MNNIKRFNELHFTDIFPNEFLVFRKEYSKYKNKGNYYVQFSDHKSDLLDRTSYDDPNHSDPSGNYGYPLKYIIDYPADLWYGHNSKYLRVLVSKPHNKVLYFNEIKTESDAHDMLRKLFGYTLSESREAFTITKRVFRTRLGAKNSGYWGRMVLQILQVDPFSSDYDDYELRSGVEQSAILLEAGFDAFGDYSKKDTVAVINNREPEQICFLTRKAFSVEKVFTLIHTKTGETSNTFTPENSKIGQNIAIELFKYMDGDRLAGRNSNPSMVVTFYSKFGRSLEVGYTKNDSYYVNKKIGQKKHKVDKITDDNKIQITIKTERGNFDYTSDSTQRIDEILRELKDGWDTIKNKEKLDGWIPRSDKQSIIEREDSKLKYFQAENEKKTIKQREEYKMWMVKYLKWCKELNLNFKFKNYDDAFTLYSEYFLPTFTVAKNSIDGALKYITEHSKKYFMFQFPDFNEDVLEDFINSFIVIIKKLVEVDPMFIEYNFNNYLDKKKGDVN